MSEDEHTYSLALAFDTDDPEFARGVEVGTIYQELLDTPGELQRLVHANNAEMMLRIAEATGRSVRSVDDGDHGWIGVTFGEAP